MWEAAKSGNNISTNVIDGVIFVCFDCFKPYTTFRSSVSVVAKATLDSDILLYVFLSFQHL